MEMTIKQRLGLGLILLAILVLISKYFFLAKDASIRPYANGSIVLFFLFGLILVIDFTRILFDPREDWRNNNLADIIRKIRYRGILYNNISIILFFLTLAVILSCFFLFFKEAPAAPSNSTAWVGELATKIGSSVLLVFLVQILFKLFKYLLRVAAFYHARADGIEFILTNTPEKKSNSGENDEGKDKTAGKRASTIDLENQKIEIEKIMAMFTPSNYDITELDKISLFDNLSEAFKPKG